MLNSHTLGGLNPVTRAVPSVIELLDQECIG
jgi:hypothetical protein